MSENTMKVAMAELEAQIAEMEEALMYLECKIGVTKKVVTLQRDVMIKHLLEGPKSHTDLAKLMDITNKNVASLKHQITNLRNEEKQPVWEILVDSAKRMHLFKANEPIVIGS